MTDVSTPSLSARLAQMEQRAQGRRPQCVCHIEVNGLTLLNAAHGLRAGDVLLRSVELALRQGTRRAADAVYCLGGDEFAVLLVGASRINALRAIRRIFAQPMVPPEWANMRLGLSVGIVEFSRARTAAEVTALADAAMCAAKRTTRTAATIAKDATSLRLALRALPGAGEALEASVALIPPEHAKAGGPSCLAS